MIQVAIIAKTQVDWATYLASAKQTLGRGVSQNIDSTGKPPKIPVGFLTSLAEIRNPAIRESQVLSNPALLLEHVSYSIAVACTAPMLKAISEESNLAVVSADSQQGILSYAVCSGSLRIWRETIVDGCSEVASPNFRKFATECLGAFEREGVRFLTSGYEKTPPDQNQSIKLIKRL